MPSHRVERVAEAIREVVSSAILFDVADPRVKGMLYLPMNTPEAAEATVKRFLGKPASASV